MNKYLYTLLLAFSSLFMAEAQQLFDLKRCIETGLEQNYSIRIIRNEQQISDNNATPGNAGYLPTVDMSGGFSGNINNNRNSLQDGSIEKANGINSETGNVGLNVNWTVFDGFGIQAEYSRLKELQRMGELNTRMTIEDFVANLSSEYYNLIRQKIRLRNLRSTLDLSKERLRIVEERYYIGSMSRLDLQQAQVDFNSDSSKVLNQLEVVHTSRIRLNELMALNNVEEEIQIKDSLIYPNPFHRRDRKTGIHPAQAWRLIIPFDKLFQVQEYPPDRNHDGVVYLISNLLCHGIEMYRLGKCTGIRHDRPSSIR